MLQSLSRLALLLLALSLLFACAPAEQAATSDEAPAESTEAAAEETAEVVIPDAPPLEIKNAKMPLPGMLTGGQPTEEEFAAAVEAGYKTIVNLRSDGEEGSWDEASKAQELGVAYVHIPLSGGDDLTPENVERFAKVLDEQSNYPMMVHCASGNRVGAMLALKAHQVDGMDPADALQLGIDGGVTKLEGAVREKLGLEAEAEAAE